MRIALIACMILASVAVGENPRPFWFRGIPGKVREGWVYGRALHVGSEHPQPGQGPAKADLDGVSLVWDRLQGANGHDANRGIPYLQRFLIPDEIPSGMAFLKFTRVDGATATIPAMVPSVVDLCEAPVIVRREIVSAPIVVAPGRVLDLGGAVIEPAESFVGGWDNAVVVLQTGARVTNGAIRISERTRAKVRSAVKLAGVNCTVDGLQIFNGIRTGYGVYVAKSSGSTVYGVDVCADRCLESEPNDWNERNTFARVRCSGPRGGFDSQVGRGIFGADALVVWCQWGNLDRGPTGSQWGSPQSRMAVFECEQFQTGVTQGASEGTLLECMQAIRCDAEIDGKVVTFAMPSGGDRRCLRVGYVVAIPQRRTWARIVSVKEEAGQWAVECDSSLGGPSTESVRIGNVIVENAFIRMKARDSRSLLWFFGAAIDNAVVNCDVRRVHDVGVRVFERDNERGSAFSWGLIDQHNTKDSGSVWFATGN